MTEHANNIGTAGSTTVPRLPLKTVQWLNSWTKLSTDLIRRCSDWSKWKSDQSWACLL